MHDVEVSAGIGDLTFKAAVTGVGYIPAAGRITLTKDTHFTDAVTSPGGVIFLGH